MVAVLRPYRVRAASLRKSRDAPSVPKTNVVIVSPCLVDDVGTSIPPQEEPPPGSRDMQHLRAHIRRAGSVL
jgi:hypothetical protein